MSSTEKCKIPHDSFCFVCGSYFFSVKTPTKTYSILTPKFQEVYRDNFDHGILECDEKWSPKVCCQTCHRRLCDKKRRIKFISPMIWMAPENHPEDCFFCQTFHLSGGKKHDRDSIRYASVTSVMKLIERVELDEGESVESHRNESTDDESLGMELEQTFRDTMDFLEAETSSVSFLQPLPTVSSSIQRTQSIAASLIKALEPIASNSEQDAALIASAMLKGLTSNSTQKGTSIASVLINALEPIAFPTPYAFRQKQTDSCIGE